MLSFLRGHRLSQVFYNNKKVALSDDPGSAARPGFSAAHPGFLGAFTVVEDGQNIEYVIMGGFGLRNIALFRNGVNIFEDAP